MTAPVTPPGWYPDATNPAVERYWDGSTWTPATRPFDRFGPEPTIPIPAQGFSAPSPATNPAPKPGHKWRNAILGGVVAIIGLSIISSLSHHDKTSNTSNVTSPLASATPSATKPVTPVKNGKKLPNLVGKGLAYADDEAQGVGFQETPHDASGRGRTPILYGDWVVCFQTPKAGLVPATSAVNLGVVKTGEQCPNTDQYSTNVQTAGATMPNFVGKSASTADDALPNASINWVDALGQGRILLIASNWHICSQSPRAGAAYNGVPVTFNVAKYGENCP